MANFFTVVLICISGLSVGQTPEPPTNFTAITQGTSSIQLNWNPAATGTTPEFYLIAANKNGGIPPTATDGTPVPNDFDFSDPNQNGAYNAPHVAGANSYLWTGLDPQTLYQYQNFAYTNAAAPNFRNGGAPTASAWTLSVEPTSQPASFTATAFSPGQINLAFSAANTISNADGYILLRNSSAFPTIAGITDGIAPGSLSLPLGTSVITTIFNGATTSYSNTGLSGSTTYYYLLIPFNFNGTNSETYNYKTNGSPLTSSATTPGATVTLTQLTTGIAPTPLGSGAINQAILGFSIVSDASTTFTSINIQATNPSTPFNNIRIFESTDNSFGPADVDQGATVNLTGSEIQISGLSEPVSPMTHYYFIVVDVDPSVNASTPVIQPSFNESHISIGSGSITPISIAGLNYSFIDASPPTLSFNPTNGSTNFPIANNLTITLSEPVRKLDDSPITPGDLTTLIELKVGNNAGPAVPFTASINAANQIVTIDPSSNLLGSTTYYLEINPVEDSNNNAISSTFITFTTEAPPSITSVNPGSTTCVGETITINGNNFSSPVVTINGVTAPQIVPATSNQIVISAPGGAAIGTFPITVTNSNGLSVNSLNFTIKPAINPGISVSPSNPGPATNVNFNILVGGSTQSGVTYRVRRISPTLGTYTATQAGNNGQLSFGPFSHATPDTYVYEVQAQSASCSNVTLTQTATVTIAELTVNAGPATATVCSGDGFALGGSPTAIGGSGFYMINWSSSPPGFSSTATNPIVNPTTSTTYTVTVTDSNGATESDDIAITVNERTDPADLDIVFNPAASSYSVNDSPVNLSFTVSGGGSGTGFFYGDGVNSTTKKFYPGAANIGADTVRLIFTNTDNCDTEISEIVNVYDPNGFISGLEPLYCPVGVDNLTINVPPNYESFVDVFLYDEANQNIPDGISWTKNLATRQVQIRLSQLPIGKNEFRIDYIIIGVVGTINVPYLDPGCLCIRYDIINILGPVATTVVVPLNIKAAPVAKMNVRSPGLEFCRNATQVEMEGGPVGGIWQGPGVTAAVGNDSNPAHSPGDNGQAQFNPATANVGFNNIRYIFEDNDGCRDTTQTTLTVFDVPQVNFTASNGCVGIPVAFNPTVTVPPTVNVFRYAWDFDDEKREISPTLDNPTYHEYSSSNDYDVTFSVITTDNCTAQVTHPISVGDIPDISLTWRNVCDTDHTRFDIQSAFFSYSPSDVNSFTWDFGDGAANIITDNNPNFADATQFYTYSNTGYYTAVASIESDLGCINRDTVQVYKVIRTFPINKDNKYFEDFNKVNFEDQGWKTGGNNSSWEWGAPVASIITDDATGGGKAWVTNLTGVFNASEKSWAHSPCFDLTEIERPVLSFDFRSLTRRQIEGVVLQVNTTGSTNIDSDWKTVGSVGNGINWYDAIGILSNPGNQPLFQTGWSNNNDTTTWRSAIIALDNTLNVIPVASRTRVRFRFAFASPESDGINIPTQEGFAFDNFRIDQRDRITLVENFTNSGGDNTSNEPNKIANAAINTFANNYQNETIKIEYHLGLGGPNSDPIYKDNPVDANARAGYYGVTLTPLVFIDSQTGGNLTNLFEAQTLKPASVTIDTIFTTTTPADMLNIEVSFTTKVNLPSNTVLQIVVVEKNIIDAGALGTNGESAFRFVMKKMLPNSLGTKYPQPIPLGTTQTVNVSWTPKAYDFNELAIIAFVQNEDTKEVYQARLLANPLNIPDPAVITAAEPSLEKLISVYPNPAHKNLTIKLPSRTEDIDIRIFNMIGSEIYSGKVEKERSGKTIETSDFVDGSYFLLLEGSDGILVRKKIMIIH